MKKIRTEIAEEVCNSKEWMPETGIYMKENAKTNKAFFEVVQGRKIERDLGEESEDVAKYGNINKEIENLKGKNGNREHGSAAQSTQQSNRRTQVNTTQLSDRGTMAGNPTTKENKAKKAEKPKKQNESKKVKEEGFVVDPTNKVKYSLMSEKAKQRRAFEYYRSKFKFFKNVRAFFMSRTEGGRNEWRQHFLAAKESEVTESAAKDFRRQMAEATYQNVMSTGEVVRTADGKIKAVKYKGQEEKVEPEGR